MSCFFTWKRFSLAPLVCIFLLASGCSSDKDSDPGNASDEETKVSETTQPAKNRFPEVDGRFVSIDSKEGLALSQATNADTAWPLTSHPIHASCSEKGASVADDYLETDQVRVYASQGVSEDQIQRAASAFHRYYQPRIEQLGLSREDFDKRNRATLSARLITDFPADNKVGVLSEAVAAVTDSDNSSSNTNELMQALAGMNASSLETIYNRAYEISGTPEQMIDLHRLINSKRLGDPERTRQRLGTHPVRFSESHTPVVCVTELDRTDSRYASWGIRVTPDFDPDAFSMAVVGHLQSRLYGGPFMDQNIPYWFLKGQAAYMGAMELASQEDAKKLNPATVESKADIGARVTNPNAVFALAYDYLQRGTSQESMRKLIRYSYLDVTEKEGSEDRMARFREGFDRWVNKPDGSDLTYEQFRDNWESLITQNG